MEELLGNSEGPLYELERCSELSSEEGSREDRSKTREDRRTPLRSPPRARSQSLGKRTEEDEHRAMMRKALEEQEVQMRREGQERLHRLEAELTARGIQLRKEALEEQEARLTGEGQARL